MTSINEQTAKKAITIVAVVHEDVPSSTSETLYADHFRPLVVELESFTERKVHVVFSGSAPYTQFDYKGDDSMATLRRWETMGFKLLSEFKKEGLEVDDLTKVILLTHDPLNDQTAGVALIWPATSTGQFAISSLGSYRYVGHEIGHLMGARHEDSETQYNGWWAETYMVPERDNIKSVSYTYSDANRQRIKNYLADKA